MNDIIPALTNSIVNYLLFASLAAAVSIPLAWAIIKFAGIRAAIHRHMIWLCLLAAIAVLPAICLYCPKLTLTVLPEKPEQTEIAEIPVVALDPAMEPVPSASDKPNLSESTDARTLSPTSPQPSAKTQSFRTNTVLAGLWLVGVAFMFARLAVGWIHLRRICRSATKPAKAEPFAGNEKLKAKILLSPNMAGPVCFGLLRPVIMLPGTMTDSAAPANLQMILSHELAHIERRDNWINILQRLIEAVFFFHPLIWYASFRLTQEREHICDNHVLAQGASAEDYIDMLRRIVESHCNETRFQAVALFEGRLLARVRTMLDPSRNARTKSSRWAKIACTVAILLCTACATVRLQDRLAADNQIYKTTTVYVVDANGRPVPDAAVEVIANHKPIAQGQTNPNGNARLKIPEGSLVTWIVALKPGVGFDYYENYRGTSHSPLPEFTAQATLVLEGARKISIRATDADGKTLADIPFVPWTIFNKGKGSHVNLSASTIARVITDNRGIAEFDWFPANTIEGGRHATSFLVQGGDYYWPEYKSYIEQGAEITARLLRNATISGKAVLPDGAAAAGITIQAEGKGNTPYFYRREVRTAADGTYRFSVYADQIYMVGVADEEWASTTRTGIVAHANESIENIDFDLARGTVITGRILSDPNEESLGGRLVYLVQDGSELPSEFHHPDFIYRKEQALVRINKTDEKGHYSFRTGPGNHVIGTASMLAHQGDYKGTELEIKSQSQITEDLHTDSWPNIPGWTIGVAFANSDRPYGGYTYAASCKHCHWPHQPQGKTAAAPKPAK